MFKKTFVLALMLGLLSGCVSHQPLKAPCNPQFCKGRIKVNTWN